jgi:hypothetical protein
MPLPMEAIMGRLFLLSSVGALALVLAPISVNVQNLDWSWHRYPSTSKTLISIMRLPKQKVATAAVTAAARAAVTAVARAAVVAAVATAVMAAVMVAVVATAVVATAVVPVVPAAVVPVAVVPAGKVPVLREGAAKAKPRRLLFRGLEMATN